MRGAMRKDGATALRHLPSAESGCAAEGHEAKYGGFSLVVGEGVKTGFLSHAKGKHTIKSPLATFLSMGLPPSVAKGDTFPARGKASMACQTKAHTDTVFYRVCTQVAYIQKPSPLRGRWQAKPDGWGFSPCGARGVNMGQRCCAIRRAPKAAALPRVAA